MTNKKFWLALAVGVPVAVVTGKQLITSPYGSRFADIVCPGYRGTDLTDNVTINDVLCKVINVFTHAMNDPVGYIISWLLLMLFSSVLAIMAVEGSRVKANALLSCVGLWGMMCNLFTVSVVLFMFWIPAYYFCYTDNNVRNYSISGARAFGILVGVLAGYVLPTIAMHFTEPWTHSQTIITAIWQFSPLYVMSIYLFATSPFACMEEQHDTRIRQEAREKRIIADSKNAVETVHVVLAVINAVVFYIMMFRLNARGYATWDTLVDIWTMHSNKFTAQSIEQIGHITATNFFLLDLLVCWLGCVFWAFLESGFTGLLILLLGTVVTGPGGGVSLYATYREGYVQDIDRLEKKDQ
ncbi:hypothetical protein BJV82DRAFT_607519 [Fennellomyces sp. T-0311]|nr:hypothetical protein BJV82DRAFT_607519 [Fennellomyces sp. T-0311]